MSLALGGITDASLAEAWLGSSRFRERPVLALPDMNRLSLVPGRERIRHPRQAVITALMVSSALLSLAACSTSKSSSVATTQPTTAASAHSATTATSPGSSSPGSSSPGSSSPGSSSPGSSSPATASPSTTSAGTQTLLSPLCTILDPSTVSAVIGGNGSCQEFQPADTAGRCLYGQLGPTPTLQLTAWTGASLSQRIASWQIGFPPVPGVGQGAWSRGVVTIGGMHNVVLYVNYGSFGLELAVNSATATLANAVTLANDVK